MNSPYPAARACTGDYERLRGWVTGQGSGLTTPRGLALLLRQGLPAWVRAWSPPVTRAVRVEATRPADAAPGIHRSVATELTTILAGMVLAATRS